MSRAAGQGDISDSGQIVMLSGAKHLHRRSQTLRRYTAQGDNMRAPNMKRTSARGLGEGRAGDRQTLRLIRGH